MNISLQNVDNVSAVLTVQIEKADYQEKVEKALKTLRQRVNMPGFRKGMVPMGLIKKQYGSDSLLSSRFSTESSIFRAASSSASR